MAEKIAVAIQKGGVGKSTTTAILAELMAASGYKVLVLDLDSQGNASQMITGENIYNFSGRTILEAMKEMNPQDYIIKCKKNLHLLPAEDMLVTFSRYIYTHNVAGKIHVLGNTIKAVENDYDIILMDCAPNLGDLTLNAIVYADHIIAPVYPGRFCMDALERFTDFVQGARDEGHTKADILGVLFTMRDRGKVEQNIADAIRQKYGSLVLNAEIKKRAKIKEFELMGVSMNKKADMDALEEYIAASVEIILRTKDVTLNGAKQQ